VVKLALAILLATSAVAHADQDGDDRAMFGYHLGGGMLPLDHRSTGTVQMGISVEHDFARRWGVFGEYEWVWLSHDQEHGDGQRAQVGIRRRLAARDWYELRFFADAEAGGGFMLANDNMTGVHAMPDAFAGLRFGYDLRAHPQHKATSSSITCELLVRALAVPGGLGGAGGIGVAWQ
jgi:hypothetical protein